MKIEFVEASDIFNKLNDLILNCKGLDIAVAFVKSAGLKTVFNIIKKSKIKQEKFPIRIVFGLSSRQGITDRKAVNELLELSKKYKNITVKKINNSRFHPKLMIFYGKTNKILLGSSNLTLAAHTKNIEANIIISDPNVDFFYAANEFFKKCYKDALLLKREHVESYIQQESSRNKSNRNFPKEDPIRSFPIISVSSEKNKKGIGKSRKSKKYYDEKIRKLQKIRKPTDAQKGSLKAYKANRSRYFGKKSEKKMDILLPVVEGLNHLKNIEKNGKGKWTIGKRIALTDSIKGGKVYFYENKKKSTTLVGDIENIQTKSGKTILSIDNVNKINERKLDSFKKRNGKSVKFVGCFVYLPT